MKYLEGYKFKASVAIIAKFIEAVFEILIPLYMSRLIDIGVNKNDTQVIYSSFFWIILLTVLGYLFALVCQVYASKVSQAVGGRIRSDLFQHELTLASDQIDAFSSSTLTTRLTVDTIFVQDMVARVIRLGVRAPFLLVGTIGALLYINTELAKILIISIPFFVIVIYLFMHLTMNAHSKASKSLDKLALRVNEMLSGTRIIRAFSKQKDIDNLFSKDNEMLYKDQKKVALYSTLANPFTTLMMNILMLLLIYASGFQINIGNMSQGQTLALISYCNQLLVTLIVGMNLLMIISRGTISYKRINKVLETKTSLIDEGNLSIEDAYDLKFNNVSFNYPNEKRLVLDNINFKVKKGEVLGIIGLTGSGKSTLLKLIPRFLNLKMGSILIDNENIDNFKIDSLRESIGYVPQSSQFIKGSLFDNVSMKQDVNVENALLDAQGHDILEKGLNHVIEESAKNLSGGQKQRINIARALAKKPKLLILDDSFSALDALTSKRLQDVLRTKYNNTSKIIASQRVSSIKSADWIIVLDQGKIVGEGKHEDLLLSNDIYQRIVQLEKEGIENE